MDEMSALEKALEAVTQWHAAFEADEIRSAGEEELDQLKAERDEMREAATNLVDQLNHVYENREYLVAWATYQVHFGDYNKNGGEQWTNEQDALAAVLAKYPGGEK